MARPRPKPTFEGQLPPPERNPLALSVSALLHVVVILVVMLLSKKLAEQQAETPKVDSAPTREVAMLYVPPPKPRPVPPPPSPRQPAPTPPPEPPRPKVINKTRNPSQTRRPRPPERRGRPRRNNRARPIPWATPPLPRRMRRRQHR